ncbi:MAG: DNA polymerase III subunit beta [Eubacteriales bacterium]|jgi:DNA polymerase-3 subunit beta|nr:DNA polymerase III subunit beta [Eubacteriales bacterium]
MKLVCDRIAITEAISIVQRAVASRSTIPALECILIKAEDGKVVLVGNDLDIGIECIIGSEIISEGKVAVNANLFGNAIRKMSGDTVTIEVSAKGIGDTDTANENNVVRIKCGNSDIKLNGVSASDFPEIHVFETKFDIILTQSELKDLIKHTIFAVGTSETKLILTGCLLEASGNNVNMVAIDGFRLAYKKIVTENDAVSGYLGDVAIVIPSKTLKEINSIIGESDDKIIIKCSNKNVRFEFDNVIFTSRLLEGDYIDYEKIIPSEFKTSIISDVRPLIEAVDRASIIITSEINKSPVIVKIEGPTANICCETSAGKVDEIVPVDMKGDDIEIGFNNKYLLEALKACTTEKINVEFVGPANPCLITPFEGDSFKYIVLPVRLRADR